MRAGNQLWEYVSNKYMLVKSAVPNAASAMAKASLPIGRCEHRETDETSPLVISDKVSKGAMDQAANS